MQKNRLIAAALALVGIVLLIIILMTFLDSGSVVTTGSRQDVVTDSLQSPDGSYRGSQTIYGLPGTPGYGNGTSLPGSPTTYPTTNPSPNPQPQTPPSDPVACTADAQLCPDGSYVGRVAPSCAFAPCP